MPTLGARVNRGPVVDAVGLYHNPPEKAVVLCVDELGRAEAR